MKCPTCHHEFRLTWERYGKALFGHHTCPSCHQRLKLVVPAAYAVLLVLVAAIFGSIPGLIVFVLTTNALDGLLTCLVFSFAIVLPLDRWLGAKYRRAEPVN